MSKKCFSILKGTLVTFDLLVALGAIGQKYKKMPHKIMLCRDRIVREPFVDIYQTHDLPLFSLLTFLRGLP
jgi:hypothetical protein